MSRSSRKNFVVATKGRLKSDEIDGVRFLELVKTNYPETLRILLTGHADLEASIMAVNRGEIYRYMRKPWIEEELKLAMNQALEVQQTRRLLRQRNQELEKAYNELDNLIYSAAHDITSPLTTILGLVALIREEPENSEEYLGMIERSPVKKLNVFTKGVIGFHRNRRTGILSNRISFQKILDSLIEDFSYFEAAQDVEFKIEITGETEFVSDRGRVITILSNLISNSIKYKDFTKDKPYLAVRVNVNPREASVVIEDNGLGIPKDRLGKIYDMYYQAGKNERQGQGLGLHIVLEIIHKLGGKIEVKSTEGAGTTFKIILPNMHESEVTVEQ